MKKESLYVIKIYKMKRKRPFCHIYTDRLEDFNRLANEVKLPGPYLHFEQIIMLKKDFDYATIE